MQTSENKRIFIWQDFSDWKLALEGMFKDILTDGLKSKVKRNPDQVEYCDDRISCEGLIGKPIEEMITIAKINEFRQRYSHIRVYHGCRPDGDGVQRYYDKGILPSLDVKEFQINRFRKIFLSGDFPELTEELLQKCIERTASYDKDLCLIIDDRILVQQYGHYLIYGSEYLCSLVTSLHFVSELSIDKYRSVLRGIGKPTVIEINLPIERVDNIEIFAVIERMITEWIYIIAHSRTESCTFDCTISLLEPLPPEHIYKTSYPSKITDPLMGYKIYNAETGEYTEED